MNTLLLLALVVGNTYRAEDFHYYDESLQGRGVPIVNKIYVDISKPKDKEEFLKFADTLDKLERFKDIRTNELNGLLLFFNNKQDTFNALNKCAKKYPAYPVVIFEGIECAVTNEIIVRVHPSVNKDNFIDRLNKVADAKFTIIKEVKPKIYLVKVNELKNPSNVLILANLIAKDNFWTRSAMVAWVPLDGFVTAAASVDTPAISHLGEMRNFRLTLDIFSPDIRIRDDLLPQLGQGLLPFPFVGEVWFDPFPPQITETKSDRKRTIVIDYPFRQLQYGNFAFNPILISYEKDGELFTTKTNTCQYSIRSVIYGTDVEDIQPRTNNGLDLVVLRPVGLPKTENPMKMAYWYAKVVGSATFFGIAAVLLFGSAIALKKQVVGWLWNDDANARIWKELHCCAYFSGNRAETQDHYLMVSGKLNNVLSQCFGVSLYSVNIDECNDNFVALIDELNKVYQQDVVFNYESLNDLLCLFCITRDYK